MPAAHSEGSVHRPTGRASAPGSRPASKPPLTRPIGGPRFRDGGGQQSLDSMPAGRRGAIDETARDVSTEKK
jgi:hypothetical protein